MAAIKAKDLKIVAMEDNQGSGKGLLQMMLEASVGGHTVARDINVLFEHLGATDEKPDVIIIDDPVVVDLRNVFQILAGAPVQSYRMGVEALRSLKDPESYWRDIPVIITGTAEAAPYLEAGAASVLAGTEMMSPEDYVRIIEETLGVEIDCDEPNQDAAIIVLSQDDEKEPKALKLEGLQITALQHRLAAKSEALSTEPGIRDLIFSDDFLAQCSAVLPTEELKKRNVLNLACVVSASLLQFAERIEKEEVLDSTRLSELINAQVAESHEPSQGLVYVLLLYAVSKEAKVANSFSSRKEPSERSLTPAIMNGFVAILQSHMAHLDHVETLGLAEKLRIMRLLDDVENPRISDEAEEEIQGIDEPRLARDLAKMLRRYETALFESALETVQDLYILVWQVTTDEDSERRMREIINESLEASIENENSTELRYDEDQIGEIIKALDERMSDAGTGPKTRALLFEMTERLRPGMNFSDMIYLAGTLASFEKFGGTAGLPVINVVNDIARVKDKIAHTVAVQPEILPEPPAFRP